MKRRIAVILVLSMGIAACANTSGTTPAFSERWHRETEAARAEERARKRASGNLVGDSGNAVRIRTDEDGRPRVQMGGERVQADVDVRGGEPRVRLRYGLKWGASDRDMPSEIPRARADAEADTGDSTDSDPPEEDEGP